MNQTVQIKGLDKLRAALLELPKAVARKRLRKPVRDAAVLIRDDARMYAPEVTGLLKSDIAVSLDTRSVQSTEVAKYDVGVKHQKGQAYYWHFVEFGTSRMPAYPFLRPAFEAKKEEALSIIVNGLTDGIQLEVAGLRWSNT